MSIRDLVSKQLAAATKPVKKPKVEAAAVEKAANAEDFMWYVYSSSTGSKLVSEPGTNELTLTEGSSFGLRPTEGSEDTLDLVAEDNLNVIFRIPLDVAATIEERSTEAESDEDDSDEDADVTDESVAE